jgi:hypothetical protein
MREHTKHTEFSRVATHRAVMDMYNNEHDKRRTRYSGRFNCGTESMDAQIEGMCISLIAGIFRWVRVSIQKRRYSYEYLRPEPMCQCANVPM